MKKLISQTAILAIISCVLWSTAFVGIKIGLQYTTPMQFAGIRFFISGILIFPFIGGFKIYRSEIRNNLRIVGVIALLQTVFQYSLFYFGINMVPASLAAIIIGSQPLFIALIAHFFMPDDKLSWQKILIFLLGLSGIIFVTFERDQFTSPGDTRVIGIILLIGVNIVSAFANILVSRDGLKMQPLALSSSTMLFGGMFLFLLSIPIEGLHIEAKPAEYYFSLVWLSLISATAISIWFILLKRRGVKVSDLNFWKFLIPVLGAVLSWIILADEEPGLVPIIGMVITAVSLVLLNLYNRRQLPEVL